MKINNVAMEISDFREVVLHYLKWKGGNIIVCCDCGILVKSTTHNKKRCNNCAIKKQKDWDNEYQQSKTVKFE